MSEVVASHPPRDRHHGRDQRRQPASKAQAWPRVGEAVTQMDQATQQNAALVEEMAAAASSLNTQAQDLVQAVAVFQLAQGHGVTRAAQHVSPAPKAPAHVAHKPIATPAKSPATANKPAASKKPAPAAAKVAAD